MTFDDPMERIIADALTDAGIAFVHEVEIEGFEQRLDFYLPAFDVYIEVKQFHSDRIAKQMSCAPNVIAAQGRPAVEFLGRMIRAGLAFA